MRRPWTITVLIIGVMLGGVVAVRRMPRDIFPTLGIPTIYVAQPYGGMDPSQMEGYLTYYYEYHFLYVTGIEHVESKSIQGATVIKLQFHPGTDMAQAMSETIAYVNRARAFMPPGTVPPFVMRFDAGSVPVGTLVLGSETRTVAEMQDAALNRVRPLFATLPGVSAPPPFGGSPRTVVINVKPDRLQAYGMSPDEIVSAIAASNVISPSGNVSLGDDYPMVPVNSVVKNVADLGTIPVRTGVDPAVFVRDVAEVVDGSDIVTSIAVVNGRRTVYMPVTKRADASTLAVVDLVKQNLPKFQSALPDDVTISYEFDQAPLVTRAIGTLLEEGALGACLTGVMVLLFLRDWRSAAIVVLNIPISLLAAVFALWLTGQTVNLMTLGGLALAVGILVDEATVAIENIHVHRASGRSLAHAVYDATVETTVPRFLAMLCILAVFLPSAFMTGVPRALFVPLSLAVGFSMIASFLLSSTLVPILAVWFPGRHVAGGAGETGAFARFASRYRRFVLRLMQLRWSVVIAYVALTGGIVVVGGARLGTDIFPTVDAGQIQLRLRAPAGTRLERTESLVTAAIDAVKAEVGADNVAVSVAFIGVHSAAYPINLIYLWNSGPEEAVVQIQLRPDTPVAVDEVQEKLRATLAATMPAVRVSFEPSDIVSRVMSLGAPAPIEVAVSGTNITADFEYAQKVRDRLAGIPTLRDLQFGQSLDYPTLKVDIDRERAGLMGVRVGEASRALVAATSSSRFTTPVYWADPKSGVAYQVQVQVPKQRMTSIEDLRNVPVAARAGEPVLLRNVASVAAGTAIGLYERYNMQRTITVTANVAGTDLGTAAAQIRDALAEMEAPPAGVTVSVRGQIVPLEEMLGGLRTGLLLALTIIVLLLAANFQSLRLALIVGSTAPAVLAGVVLALWITKTTINVQSYIGAIMAVGVAVANAILLTTFAERARLDGLGAVDAAVDGAGSRLRPILMTGSAMIAGMIPMAIGFGEGGEQSAPLGRAVVGGLSAATVATLVVLPAVFAIVQGRASAASASMYPSDIDADRTRVAGEEAR